MNSKLFISFFCGLLIAYTPAFAQDDLMDLLDEEPQTEYTFATFKSNRLINGHSIETVGEGELNFVISHKFGRLNSGAYEFFGLDNAHIRLGLEYGLSDRLNIGIGRNSFNKVYDAYAKYQLLRQSTGARSIPFSVTAFGSTAMTTIKQTVNEQDVTTKHSMSHTAQLLIARKFSPSFSLQLMPSWVHHNLVTSSEDSNDQFALGVGGRMKLTKRTSFNMEYYYRLNPAVSSNYYNAIALGFDIETGGHVFQLHVTNAQAMIEKAFITETQGNFLNGDIHFGFSISRGFNLIPDSEKPSDW